MVPFALAFMAALTFATMMLWNALLPQIFGTRTISFWQAAGLFVLSRILFGRFGGRRHGMRGGPFGRGWRGMNREERERFRSAMQQRGCGTAREERA